MNFGAVIEFEVTGYPSHFSIHTSFWDSYPASIIEVAIKSGNFWVPLGSVTYQGTGCGWYQYELPGAVVWGCTDEGACNFNSEATLDDESCEYGCLNCGPGTVWDESVQLCVGANPSDTDFDGCVGMTDLLDLLSAFGTCVEEDPEVVEWSCGDPLEYQGYNYETVQIGEQCWFAEDLRSTHFLDGSPIPSLQDTGGNWTDLTEPAYGYYEMENWISDETPLFNHFVVQDDRGVCPSGWKVPGIEDMPVGSPNGVWPNLEYRGYINADPANLLFMGGGFEVWYWSETIEDDRAYDIGIWSFDDHIVSGHHIYQYGFSIRCIKDSE